jgi:glycosyltransferase involved in cell wall biosynthesis
VRNVCGGAYRGHVSVHGTAELTAREEISDYPYFFRTDLEADILIPVFRPNEEVGGTLAEIYRKTIPPYNIIISSKEQSAARNRNYGLERSRSPYVIMCDDDITALPWGWNRTLIEILKAHGDVIAVSARLLDRKGRVGRNSANNYDLSRPLVTVKNIPTACCAFRSTDTRCDERYVRAGWEDTDFFLQMKEKHGGRIVIANDVRVVHLNEEKNEGGAGNVENQKLFHDKWKGHRLVMPFEEPDREEMRREIFSLTEDLNHRKAVQAIERFLSRFGDDVDMLILLARTLRKMKRPEKAVIPALKAAGLDPRNGEAVRELVETSYLIEEFGFVEGYARTMIKCHGEIPQLLYLLADSLFRQGKLEEARVLLETLRGTRPYLVAAADLAQRIDGALCASAA